MLHGRAANGLAPVRRGRRRAVHDAGDRKGRFGAVPPPAAPPFAAPPRPPSRSGAAKGGAAGGGTAPKRPAAGASGRARDGGREETSELLALLQQYDVPGTATKPSRKPQQRRGGRSPLAAANRGAAPAGAAPTKARPASRGRAAGAVRS